MLTATLFTLKVRSYAHFQHLNYDCIEVLLKISINRATDFNMQTLAVTVNSLAELDITNPTLLQITKQILLSRIDEKARGPMDEPYSNANK